MLLAALPGVLVVLALLYMLGMEHLEGHPRSFATAFAWAAETLTSTGYGGDNHWDHPVMIGFVVICQFMGMSLAFLVFPLLVMPYFEQRFEGRLPRGVPELRDYVLVYRWSPAVDSLLGELDRAKVPVVVYEEDEALARRLRDRGRVVIYGVLEDDDLDARLRPLHWLNDKLSISLKMISITRPETDDSQVYAWADWEAALHLERLSQSDPQAEAAAEARGKVTREKFLAAVTLTATPFYAQLFEDLGASVATLDRLRHWLERECGHEAPSLTRFRETLEVQLRFVAGLLEERHDTVAEVEGDVLDDASTALAMDEGERLFSSGGPISSRAEAYRRLHEASDYLLRTEPHSPAPYLVRRAIAWGGMSLAELLEELLAENADLRTVYRLLGIRQ